MAEAPTLTKQQVQKSLRQKHEKANNKKVATKNVLHSPFELTWPQVPVQVRKQIMESLTEFFNKHKLERPKLRHCRNKKERGQKLKEHYAGLSETSKFLIKNVVVGINGVTKSLEKDQLSLVLVDRSANPALLTNHLISLSAVVKCPAGAVANLSDTMCPLLGVTSLTAVGFRKTDPDEFEELNELVSSIRNKLTPIEIPWLGQSQQLSQETAHSEESGTTKSAETSTKDTDKKTEPSEEIDISEFYILKKDSDKYKRERIAKRAQSTKSNVTDHSMEFENSADFVSFRTESSENDTLSSSVFMETSKDDSCAKKMKMVYEDTKVKRLRGNPDKVKKKKKKKKK